MILCLANIIQNYAKVFGTTMQNCEHIFINLDCRSYLFVYIILLYCNRKVHGMPNRISINLKRPINERSVHDSSLFYSYYKYYYHRNVVRISVI